MEILWNIAGALLVLLVLTDVYLVVLHLDRGGIITPKLYNGTWRVIVRLSGRYPRARRGLLSLAGPTMLVLMLTQWLTLFIVGFALVYWPYMHHFRTDPEITTLGLAEALYYSGGTTTVLGHGEITPLHPALQAITVVQSGVGFVLLTGLVAYLLSVATGVTARNALALRLHHESGRTDDGVHIALRTFDPDDPTPLRSRITALTATLQSLRPQMNQFPIVDLYYRSRDATLDPETMLHTATHFAIATLILSRHPVAASQRADAEDLANSLTDMMTLIAHQYLPSPARHALEQPQPNDQDRQTVRTIEARLRTELPLDAPPQQPDEAALHLTARSRVFFTALQAHTGWRDDHETKHFS